MLNPQIKKTIVDALIKVVDSAPIKSNNQYNWYTPNFTDRSNISGNRYNESNIVSDENFRVWTTYLFSVLNIASKEVDANLSYSVYKQIERILQRDCDNMSKTISMCRIILDYARNILSM